MKKSGKQKCYTDPRPILLAKCGVDEWWIQMCLHCQRHCVRVRQSNSQFTINGVNGDSDIAGIMGLELLCSISRSI